MKKVLVYYEPETGTNGTGGTPAPTGAPYIPTQAPTDGATPISGTYDYVAGNSPYSQIKSVAAAPTPAPVPTGAPYILSLAPTSSPVAGESIAPGTSAPTPGTYDYVIQNGPFSQITSGTPAPSSTTRTGAPYIPSPTPTSTASSATSAPTTSSTTSSTSSTSTSATSSATATASTTTQVSGGDTVVINGKELRVSGYVDIGNGEKVVTYTDYDPSKWASYGDTMKGTAYANSTEYYVDKNGTLQVMQRNRASTNNYMSEDDSVVIDGQTYKSWNSTWKPVLKETDPNYSTTIDVNSNSTSGKAVTNTYASVKTINTGDKVNLEGNDYTVKGYIDLGDGAKHAVYYRPGWSQDHYCYLDSDGKLQELLCRDGKYSMDGKTWFELNKDGTFEPSEMDKKVLSGDNYKPETDQETPSAPATPGINYGADPRFSVDKNVEYNLNSELTKRKEFYIKYTKEDDTTVQDGPYYSAESRQLALNVYNMTPGQGKGASTTSVNFQKIIGRIRGSLDDVFDLTKDGIVRIQNGTRIYEGNNDTRIILDSLSSITPDVYKKFANKVLPPAINYSNEKQKKTNSITREEVKKKHSGAYISSEQNVSEDIAGKYKSYLAGNEYTKSTIVLSSSLPRKTGTIGSDSGDGLYYNPANTDVIIDTLRIVINNYIISANDIINSQVAKLNSAGGSSIGKISASDVNTKVIELRDALQKLRNKFIEWKAEAVKFGSNTTASTTGNGNNNRNNNNNNNNNRNNSNGGNRSTGGSNTPEPTTKAILIGSTPSPSTTTTPTPTPTPTATATPTPSLTQGPLPVDNPSGGGISNGNNNGNGNSNGGTNYSNGVQWTGGENPVTTPTVTEAPIEVATSAPVEVEEDNLIIGKKYNIPTSTKTIATTPAPSSRSGNAVIPVVAGIGAAAAAGIGAKAYIDRKKNRNNGEENNFTAEDWSEDNKVDIKYSEPLNNEETLEFDA